MFMIDVVLDDVLFNDVLISEYGELLLQRRLFLYRNIQFNKRRMYVLHYFEQEK